MGLADGIDVAGGVLDGGTVEKRVGLAHATSSSWGET
jgi:hypothetical protein